MIRSMCIGCGREPENCACDTSPGVTGGTVQGLFKPKLTYHRDTCPVFEGGACTCENLGGAPRDSGGGAGADPVVLYERPARSVILSQWLKLVEAQAAELNSRLRQREPTSELRLAQLRLEECLLYVRESVR